jgi:hypothetical protein
MALPNGWNTFPNAWRFDDIAGGVGSIGTTYYVDCNAGADTNDGLSWAYPMKKLSVALAASHANIAADSTGWASRNRIFFKGDQTATAEGENLTKLAQKTDIIGVGSTDWKHKPQLIGNHTVTAGTQYLGCRFINVAFHGPVLSGGDIFTVTGQHGLSFIGCTFDGTSTMPATAALLMTACQMLTVKDCVFFGAFSDAVIEIAAGAADNLVIEGNHIQGANMGIDISDSATFSADRYGLIRNNIFNVTTIIVNDAAGKSVIVDNTGCTAAAKEVETVLVSGTGLAANNNFGNATGWGVYPAVAAIT